MATVEERLTALESEVQAVKRQLATIDPPRAWLDEVVGSMDAWPEFEEVLRRPTLKPAGDTLFNSP